MYIEGFLLILGGYLLGSIPTAYLAGQVTRHIDLRHYGSGTVSGSMVYEHVSHWMIVPVGLFDIAKGALPTWIGLQLGMGDAIASIAGLAAVAGHNWPIYLGFSGGRGITPFLGLLLVLLPWGFPWMLVFLAIGFALGDSAPWALFSLVSMPLLIAWLKAPSVLNLTVVGMLFLTVVKRLEANRRSLPPHGINRWKVVLLRLLLDRDILDHKKWIRRTPNQP
jgi:glycerol-3-phosphate acyltransferase PlsY